MYFNNLEGKEMEEIAMTNPGVRKAMTIEQIFLKNKKERRLYELREKAARDEISMVTGAKEEGKAEGKIEGRAEGKIEGRAEGKIEMARSAICKYLDARFSSNSLGLQEEVGAINNLVVLDKIIGKIYTANTMEEAATIVKESTLS
jgi:predicted transposase/invertase (TIGR01784 family)